MAAFSSLILRFRDLSTPAGTTTIGEHKRYLSDGHVWWGWWHKQGETVPEHAFRDILAEIRNSGQYRVFLFDTGSYKLHSASLEDIRWDTTLSRIPTPNIGMTPAYYGHAHYLAWFKLTKIDDCLIEELELKNWSYVRVDDFFETRKSVFNAFYDKQLTSFTELRNQDRTIWFIRPRNRADAAHEIHVYDRSKTAPSNFPEHIIPLHTPNLLWVSDPHFSEDHHDFPLIPNESRLNLSEAIRRDLAHQQIESVGGLVISGDLTWRGSRDEFDRARKFIEDIKSWAKLTESHILICPGNHDLAFSDEPWTKGSPAKELGPAATAEYKHFYEDLYETKTTDEITCGRRFWLPDGGLADVVSLNSSVLQQIEGAFQGQGFLGRTQLQFAADSMKWSHNPDRAKAFRICVLHHHVVPILYREHPEIGSAASVVYDAGAFMRWLTENEVNLVLHGHMHIPSFVKERRALDFPKQEKWHEIAVAALGSSGVTAQHRPNQHNCYGLIRFGRDSVYLTVRSITADDSLHHEQRTVFEVAIQYGE